VRNGSIQTYRVTSFKYATEEGTEPLFQAVDEESGQASCGDRAQSTVEGLDPAARAGSPLHTPAVITAS